MFLLDDHLFKLWKDGLVAKEEILMRSSNPGELAKKVARAEKGLGDEEGPADAGAGEGDEDRPRGKPPLRR